MNGVAAPLGLCCCASARWVASVTRRLIVPIELVISSAEPATVWTLALAWLAALATALALLLVSLAARDKVSALRSSCTAEDATLSTTLATSSLKLLMRASRYVDRSAWCCASCNCRSVSRRRSMPLVLKTSSAPAKRPISFEPPSPGTGVSNFWSATSRMACTIAASGCRMPLRTTNQVVRQIAKAMTVITPQATRK